MTLSRNYRGTHAAYALRASHGFTLVEAIVVAVIVAVLAAVAIPLYSGYLRDSRVKTAENIAASVASAYGGLTAFDPTAEVPEGMFCSDNGTPAVISVPAQDGLDGKIISVPDGFTVVINKTTRSVVCSYNKDPSIESKTHFF
jgi:prepilin-type N-terminal cleavage/methylation domain-containing protein